MHAPYILSADNLGAISLEFCRKPYILEADDFLGACSKRKAMTLQEAKSYGDFTSSNALRSLTELVNDGQRADWH